MPQRPRSNPPSPPSPPKISEAEWEVMRVLWDLGEAEAHEVVQEVGRVRDWSDRTVKTLLARLVRKEALDFEPVGKGKRYRYRPLVSREDCVRAESRSFVQRVFGGDVSPLLATFVRDGELSKAEIAELRRLLDEEESK